jgi:hypothetical protein
MFDSGLEDAKPVVGCSVLEPPSGAWFSGAPQQPKAVAQEHSRRKPRQQLPLQRVPKVVRRSDVERLTAASSVSRVPAENAGLGSTFYLTEGETVRRQQWEEQRPQLMKEFKQQRRDAVRRRHKTGREYDTDS